MGSARKLRLVPTNNLMTLSSLSIIHCALISEEKLFLNNVDFVFLQIFMLPHITLPVGIVSPVEKNQLSLTNPRWPSSETQLYLQHKLIVIWF